MSKLAAENAGNGKCAGILLYRRNVTGKPPDSRKKHSVKGAERLRTKAREGRILATQIMDFFTAQTDKLMLVGMLALIVLSALQLARMSRTNRQLKYLTDKLAGYLKAVLEDEEESAAEEPGETEFVSKQEQNMREAIELQKQQKKIKDAQVFDAVLSEIFP